MNLFLMLSVMLVLFTPVVSCSSASKGFTSLSEEQKEVLAYLPRDIVISHRGTTYWAPEETEAAMRWARNTGGDYLECDIQRTKDGYLLALHDEDLQRTTDVAEKFPERKDAPVSEFTLEELLTLDAGSWFNKACPERARKGFSGLDILTLEDVIRVAEGNRILRDSTGKRLYRKENGKIIMQYEKDPADNGNRPGIYPETKEPRLFPGIERDLRNELERLGWYAVDRDSLKSVPTTEGKVGIANTPARVILQTFSRESLRKLREAFPRLIPTCQLLWLGENDMKNDAPETYAKWVDYAIEQGAVIMGPSIGGEPNRYDDLLKPWMAALVFNSGMQIHAYSFDTEEQMKKYLGSTYVLEGVGKRNLVDGLFTNLTDETILFYRDHINFENRQKNKPLESSEKVLERLGY
ncbi:glycerophosphodiester phosphodiesterase family protein [Sanguibacteroides justesenii]|uniref:glycerophosphodiester phosphodiesterase family protein n=1 Tax=Sanguibacteroides justesenii TaxID=1547597 RepID=UPI0006974065|nr:glycerophosphodiester phosphodiesterase family protein [Sanguibacteroides justesenii]